MVVVLGPRSLIKALALCVLVGDLASAATSKCLPSGTDVEINDALRKGGAHTTVSLCPGSVHNLYNPIKFVAASQTLTTEGDRKDHLRALLIVRGENQATAIKADCAQCSGGQIRSLQVDGNRPMLLRVPKGGALLELGNSERQTVRDCRLWEPRGWSCLHFREGDRLQCTDGLVKDNEIGPAGEEWDFDYDGSKEPEPRYGNPRADGISLACKNSVVEGNIVYDTTDAAIVLFGSAGTDVRNNKVYSRTRVLMGAINLVDMLPWQGNYRDVSIRNNYIGAHGAYIRGGINVGPAVWGDDTDGVVYGGSITGNTIEGDHIGYGIVVTSAKDFTILRNKSTAKYSGVKGPTCPTAPENADPMAFLINKGSSEGNFQAEFVNGEVQHVICIDPTTEDGEPYKPWRMRDSPEAAAARIEEGGGGGAGGGASNAAVDAALSEGLVSYQMVLMQAMSEVTEKLVAAGTSEEKRQKGRKGGGNREKKTSTKNKDSPYTSALADLSTRLANLESEKQQVRASFDRIKSDLKRHVQTLQASKRDQKGMMTTVLDLARARTPRKAADSVRAIADDLVQAQQSLSSGSFWTSVFVFAMLQSLLLVAVYLAHRLLNGRGDRHARNRFRNSENGRGLNGGSIGRQQGMFAGGGESGSGGDGSGHRRDHSSASGGGRFKAASPKPREKYLSLD